MTTLYLHHVSIIVTSHQIPPHFKWSLIQNNMFPDPWSQNAEAYQWCKGFYCVEKPAGDKVEQGCDVLPGVLEKLPHLWGQTLPPRTTEVNDCYWHVSNLGSADVRRHRQVCCHTSKESWLGVWCMRVVLCFSVKKNPHTAKGGLVRLSLVVGWLVQRLSSHHTWRPRSGRYRNKCNRMEAPDWVGSTSGGGKVWLNDRMLWEINLMQT